LILTLCSLAFAEPESEGELWYDHAHGLIMTLPPNTTRIEDPIDKALIRLTSPISSGGYNIHATVRQNAKRKTIVQLADQAMAEVSITSVQPTKLEIRFIKLSERSSVVIYYRHADRNAQVIQRVFKNAKKRPWIMGQALILLPSLITPGVERMPSERMLVVQMDVDEPNSNQGKDAFEAMLASLQIDDPKSLALRRMQCLSTSAKWRKSLKFDDWKACALAEQLFSIRKDDIDIGYMRVQQLPGIELNHQGLHVVVEARFIENNRAIDTQFKAFWSDNDANEFWSKIITDRPLKALGLNNPRNSEGTTWSETGIRQDQTISVVRRGPAGSKTYHWQKPPDGYLSQVQTHLLGQMFTTAPQSEMGFYAYFSSNNSIAYRTERIEHNPTSGYRVFSRPNLEKSQFVTIYNRKGLALSQQLPNGTQIVITTKAKLAARWKYSIH